MEDSQYETAIKLWTLAELEVEWSAFSSSFGVDYYAWEKPRETTLVQHNIFILGLGTREVICFRLSGALPVEFGFLKTVSSDWIPVGLSSFGTFGTVCGRDLCGNPFRLQFPLDDPGELREVRMESLPLMHFLLRCNLESKHWEKMGLLGIHKSWWLVLCKELSKPYFKKLCDFIVDERYENTIYPAANNTFAWTRHFSPEDVKVVIVGQDPYPTGDKATGLAFNLPEGEPSSASLDAISRALKQSVPISGSLGYGNLIGWAKQGVLLLNAALTVREGEPGSHMKAWKKFTNAVLHYISWKNPGAVFFLWGKKFWEKEDVIDFHNYYVEEQSNGELLPRHLVLKSYHPAYPSCDCPNKPKEHLQNGCKNLTRGFHFAIANQFLEMRDRDQIRWDELYNF